ncbi:hypothetical protein [Vibrio owensii]|uniref:hypothetical protein n=1 Tax=Vibrio owensii TaxID=696485 RepID=UPI003CC56C7A
MSSLKKLAVFALIIASTPTLATTCNFKSIDGERYEFAQISPYSSYVNEAQLNRASDTYSHFVERDKTTHLTAFQYYGREFKIIDSPFEIVQKPNNSNPLKTHNVRYYNAVADNCNKFLIEVDEHDQQFEKYFNAQNHALDGSFPFIVEQSALQAIHIDSLSKAESHVGKVIYYLNHESDKKVPLKPLTDQDSTEFASNLLGYKIVSIDYEAFDLAGNYTSEFGFIVENQKGEKFRAPFIKELVAWADPTKDSKVRGKYVPFIKQGDIAYGMNAHEITLAWGVPQTIKYEGVYTNPLNNTSFVQSILWPYGGDGHDFPMDYTLYTGKMQKWFYPSKLLDGEYLKLDEDGIMRKYMQHENIHENVIQPRKFAK